MLFVCQTYLVFLEVFLLSRKRPAHFHSDCFPRFYITQVFFICISFYVSYLPGSPLSLTITRSLICYKCVNFSLLSSYSSVRISCKRYLELYYNWTRVITLFYMGLICFIGAYKSRRDAYQNNIHSFIHQVLCFSPTSLNSMLIDTIVTAY